MASSKVLIAVALMALLACVRAQCPTECTGATPVCDLGSLTCVPCTTQSQCWAVSNNELSCDLASGECKNCNSSSTCPEAAPICSQVSFTCATCNATAECALRISGSVCDVDVGSCGWCTADLDCATYGEGSVCQNITDIVRKCTIPSVGPITTPGLPDPNNINGVITAYVIICIVLLLLFIMFVVCACTKDEDYSPTNAQTYEQMDSPKVHSMSPRANGNHTNGTTEIEMDSPPKGKSKK